jgi:hypothetical protein
MTVKILDAKTMAADVVTAIRGFISRALEARDERIAALEDAVNVKFREPMASLERRISRHAEHLARLEDRTQKIEKGGNR